MTAGWSFTTLAYVKEMDGYKFSLVTIELADCESYYRVSLLSKVHVHKRENFLDPILDF
jgi:hypothetical protein